jgi:outer membrane lipase/esterase
MMLKKAALAGASLLCLAHHAEAQNFNQLIAFGDSTTDTGYLAITKLEPVDHPNPILRVIDQFIENSLDHNGNAHFTGPGLGNAQILGSFFGLPANPANTLGGTNYAIGGAFNDATVFASPFNNQTGPGLENLFLAHPFLNLFGTFVTPNLELPGTEGQIGNYLASVGGHANPNALYLVSSGGNDAFFADAVLPTQDARADAFLLSEAQQLAGAVAELQQKGARYIIVANEYQPPGASPALIHYGTTIFDATLTDLREAGVKFIFADTAAVIEAVKQNPLAFGITAPLDENACISQA